MKGINESFFIIDGHSLIYRSYFTFINNPRINSKGFNTGAIYGFINILLSILKKENPKYLAIVFDTKEITWRKKEFVEYKANRPKQPQEITDSFPYVKQILNALKIKYIEYPGYEADDIIGTIALRTPEEINVFMMTSDKDYDQLVKNNVFVYKPIRHSFGYDIINVTKVKEKWGISDPKQVIDMLALCGDISDNIPGVKGIGFKTASSLLKEYETVEKIYENIDKLKDNIKKMFLNNEKQSFLSKKLATINCEVPVVEQISDFVIKDFDIDTLVNIFKDLEFDSLIKIIIAKFKKQAEIEF